jgi:hypothetical protein
MPDNIERIIYKVEIDDSGYIRGTDAMAASTAKFTKEQEQANATLKTNEAALKVNTDRLNKAKKDLEDYAGTNARYRKQLDNDVKSAEKDQQQLTELVDKNRIAYEEATKAASDFATIAVKASRVQQPSGKIPVPSPVPQPQLAAGLQDALSQISLGDLPDALGKVLPEFEELRRVIGLAEEKMKSLNAEDEEFKQLGPIVTKGKEALQLYDEATKKTTGSQQSLRTQLRLGREELVKMEQAGRGTSKEYFELEKHVAKLTDEFGDQQERIRVLANDTRLLTFGKSAIQAATAAFQTYTSVAILAGDESEELQKKTMQLFAAMQLLTSLEEISNAVKRGSVLATEAQSAATAIYAAVVGTATGALKAFRIALLATGIVAAVAAIGYLVYRYQQMKKATEEAGRANKELNAIREKAIEGYAKEVSQLEILRLKLSSQQTPLNERIRLAKEYNKTADEGAKIDLKQITNIDLLNAAIDRNIQKIEERALAQAAANAAEEKAAILFKAQEKVAEIAPKFEINLPKIDKEIQNVQDQLDNLSFSEFTKENVALTKHLQELRAALVDVKSANENFTRSATLAAKLPTTPEPTTTKTPTTKSTVDNVFEQERQKQRERLAELNRKAVEDERTIRAQFEQQLIAEKLRIDNLLKDKKLKKPQAATLKLEAAKINTAELDKSLEDFNKKVIDTREKLNKEIRDLQNKSIQESINLLQDEFDRRKQTIDFNEQKELEDSKQNIEDRLKALGLDRLLIGEDNYQRDRLALINAGEQQANNIVAKYAGERKDLAFDIFKGTLASIESYIQFTDLQIGEAANKEIHNLSERFLSGQINFERYQKELTKIQKKAELERKQSALDTEREELRLLENEIATAQKLTIKQLEELIKKRDELRAKVSSDQSNIDQGTSTDTHDEATKKAEEVVKYVDAIGNLTDSVVQFWQKANEAEQKALDHSIELQQRRVDAAQRIADRGNAQYLKQEQDRLTELEVKRENAARRQLGIDAALQASQLLVGITGAIAKISTGIGAAETIAEIAVIVGALATGYGLVKSLQGNQPRLFVGTTDTGPGKNVDDKGGFHAILHPHEAVIPADKNRKYKPTVEAIYHGKVPAEAINTFVHNYSKNFVSTHVDSIPRVNTEKIKHTAELSVSHDGRLAAMVSDQNRLITENNDLQRQTLRAMKSMSVSANIDRNGVAIMVNEYIEQMNIDKRT